MSLLTKIIIAALSSAGLLSGVALSYIAPEELAAGRKYFIYLLSILFVVDLKIESTLAYLFHYLAFLTAYFLIQDGILIAALLFLYGFPAGTLLRMKHA